MAKYPTRHSPPSNRPSSGKWLALAAALLGWMFDGLEMGLFPVAARPALQDLLGPTLEAQIGLWFSVATAGFLIGAATGGVLFGWLGDRVGRVRAMMLSVLTYAAFSGLCGLAQEAWHIAALRSIAALGMGGEWSLGVALVMEIWPDRSRAMLAGLIGAVANLGYLLIGALSLVLGHFLNQAARVLADLGLPQSWIQQLVAHGGWRLLMFLGAAPALLTIGIRMFVPESQRWRDERRRGTTSHWATSDLLGVAIGALGAVALIYLWAAEWNWPARLAGSAIALTVLTCGYLFPVARFLRRYRARQPGEVRTPVIRHMVLGASLGGVALLGTWASIQWAPLWADQLTGGTMPEAKAVTQIWSAFGAVLGTMAAAYMGNWLGRRGSYRVLCLASLGAALLFFQANTHYGKQFLASVCLAGACTASFYGWLPLYLPELFPTGVRATGQGFSFNFGRVLAAVGTLQTGSLIGYFGNSYPKACSVMSLVYVAGLFLIGLAPETQGQPLPE